MVELTSTDQEEMIRQKVGQGDDSYRGGNKETGKSKSKGETKCTDVDLDEHQIFVKT